MMSFLVRHASVKELHWKRKVGHLCLVAAIIEHLTSIHHRTLGNVTSMEDFVFLNNSKFHVTIVCTMTWHFETFTNSHVYSIHISSDPPEHSTSRQSCFRIAPWNTRCPRYQPVHERISPCFRRKGEIHSSSFDTFLFLLAPLLELSIVFHRDLARSPSFVNIEHGWTRDNECSIDL